MCLLADCSFLLGGILPNFGPIFLVYVLIQVNEINTQFEPILCQKHNFEFDTY